MTAKRDLKKRIRERASRTGERYTTAREHVLAARSEAQPLNVVELEDLSEEAARLGFRCRVRAMPGLLRRIDPTVVLQRLLDALRATAGDPAMEILRGAALHGERKEVETRSIQALSDIRTFFERAEAGIGGVSAGGHMVALPVAGSRGIEMILCMHWPTPVAWQLFEPALVLTTPGELRLEATSILPRFFR
jgi:hypothetical protein